MKTIEEFLKEEFEIIRELAPAISHDFKLKAIDFTKMHVEAALKEAAEQKFTSSILDIQVEHTPNAKKSILNAYPLNNIV